jgi:hypothetical protein
VSAKALALVKPMTKSARTGEGLTTPEQLLLWYIADCYNDEQKAAWCGNRSLGRDNNLGIRRVNEITAELVRKEIIWREPRYHDVSGREMSNWWRFYELDGEPPQEVKLWEEKHRVRGELRSQKRKKGAGNPQEGCGEACIPPHGDHAEERMDPGISSQGDHAEERMVGCAIAHGQGCAIAHGDHAEERMQNSYMNLQTDSAQDPQVELSLNESIETPRAAAAEKNSFENLWALILAELASAAVIDEAQYLRLSVETSQLEAVGEYGGVLLAVGVSVGSDVRLPVDDLPWALERLGLDPKSSDVSFEQIQRVRRA